MNLARPTCPPPPASAYAGFAVGDFTTYSQKLTVRGYQLLLPGIVTQATDWWWCGPRACWELCNDTVLLMESDLVCIRACDYPLTLWDAPAEVGQKPEAEKTEGDRLYEFFCGRKK